ncbi:MAG: hypothetical protein ACK5KK_00190 [Microbacterium sp.]
MVMVSGGLLAALAGCGGSAGVLRDAQVSTEEASLGGADFAMYLSPQSYEMTDQSVGWVVLADTDGELVKYFVYASSGMF